MARRAIADGAVFLNGRRCRLAGRMVRAGDTVKIRHGAPITEAVPLTVLYEDTAVVAVDKPAGIPATPTRVAARGTAQDLLQQQLRQRDHRSIRLWAVHRLDAGTSGVFVFAKHRAAAAALSLAFQTQAVEKRYLALAAGIITEATGRIDQPIRTDGRRAVVAADGKPARTDWRVLRRSADTTLLELHPQTGRMHQIRIHLRAIGHPVVGDRSYGGPTSPRLMLHAMRLRFPHPDDGHSVEVQAAAPAAFVLDD